MSLEEWKGGAESNKILGRTGVAASRWSLCVRINDAVSQPGADDQAAARSPLAKSSADRRRQRLGQGGQSA
jgi:hypothetical protein